MVFASLMAFGLTRYHFKGKELIRSLIVASLMFPVFSTIIPVFKMMVEWGLLNKSIAVILPQIAGNLSFATIVMTGFMQSIPLEMEEAAYMEGADVFKVFGKIIVPLCRPSLATVAIFSFLWSYNDLFVQKIMMRDPTRYQMCIRDSSYLDGSKVYFKNGGWVIARFSGTEPLLRIFCEMPDAVEAADICTRYEQFLDL